MAPSGGRLGAKAPSSQSRRFMRKPLCPYNNDVLDAVQPRVEAKFHAQSLLQFATCTIPGYTAINNDQTAYIDYTGEKYANLPPGLPANLIKIKLIKVKNLLANTRKVLPGGVNVAVLCVRFRHYTTTCSSMRAAVLWRAQQQHLSLPSAGTRPQQKCQVPSAKLETKKDGCNTDTDVRDSHKIQEVEKEQKKATATHHVIAQRMETVS